MADEGRDYANLEQLIIVMRYFDKSCGKVMDRFLSMKSVVNTGHKSLFNKIVEEMEKFDLKLE